MTAASGEGKGIRINLSSDQHLLHRRTSLRTVIFLGLNPRWKSNPKIRPTLSSQLFSRTESENLWIRTKIKTVRYIQFPPPHTPYILFWNIITPLIFEKQIFEKQYILGSLYACYDVSLKSKIISKLMVLSRSIAYFCRVANPCNGMYVSICPLNLDSIVVVVVITHIDMNIIININIILAWKIQLFKWIYILLFQVYGFSLLPSGQLDPNC